MKGVLVSRKDLKNSKSTADFAYWVDSTSHLLGGNAKGIGKGVSIMYIYIYKYETYSLDCNPARSSGCDKALPSRKLNQYF